MRPYAERVEASVTDFERHLIFTDPSRNRDFRVACPASRRPPAMAAGLLDKFHARYPALADRAVPRVFILVYILHPSGGGLLQVRWTYSPWLGK